MTEALPLEDAKRLIRLCERGRLYEVEDWIRSGQPLKVPDELGKTPLSVALRTGFHSLIELLLRHEEDQRIRNNVLRQAVEARRHDLVELAVAYGAEPSSVPFADVLMSWDRQIMSFFAERGADLITNLPFAHAFHGRVGTALGCYLECKRSRPEFAAQLQEQADMALRHFCREGSLKWVSLLMWAGADPRSQGPMPECADDPEMSTTALDEACAAGHLEILKRLKPDSSRDDLGDLLTSAATSARTNVISYLLGLGANPNDKPNGGSSALDACIRHLGWESTDRVLYGRHHQISSYKVLTTREAIRLLVEHGAVWKPSDSLNDVRRTLYGIDPEVTVELVGLLMKHRACDDATLRDLLRTPRMRQHMKASAQHLARLGLTLDGRRRSKAGSRNPQPSPYVLNRYDRRQLYDEVWSAPTRQVAARYGISDVALTKVCHQLRVPKPPRGYWAKKAAGNVAPRRPKLPALSTNLSSG
jgi:ankyrin repeat protein